MPNELVKKYTDAFDTVVDRYAEEGKYLGTSVGPSLSSLRVSLEGGRGTYMDKMRVGILCEFLEHIRDSHGAPLTAFAQAVKNTYAREIAGLPALKEVVIRWFNRDIDKHVKFLKEKAAVAAAAGGGDPLAEYVTRELKWIDNHRLGNTEPAVLAGSMGVSMIRRLLEHAASGGFSKREGADIDEDASDIKRTFANYMRNEKIHVLDV